MPSKNLCHNLSVCSGFVNFATSKSGGSCRRRQGEMVEWSITPVLKTGIRRRIGGSNPSLSAFKTKRESCDSLFLCLIANALYLQRSDYGERERFIP